MRHWAMGGISALLLLAGCAHERPVAPHPAAPTAPLPSAGSEQKAQTTAAAQAAPQQPSAPPAAAESAPAPGTAAAGTPEAGTAGAGAEHAPGAAAAASSRGTSRAHAPGSGSAAGSGSANARAPERGEATPGAAGGAPAGAAVAQTPSPAPALDLTALEQRLRDTRAIGVFTKLSLKNQVDDLLGEFRAFHRGLGTLKLADLRQRYDLLLLKVLSLLQDGDPSLAAAISSSREAIWAILVDPQKFAKLAST